MQDKTKQKNEKKMKKKRQDKTRKTRKNKRNKTRQAFLKIGCNARFKRIQLLK